MADLGVLVIHGMGSQVTGFDLDFKAKLQAALGGDFSRIAWNPVLWAPVVSGAETEMWKRVSRDAHLEWTSLRRFFVNYFADAVAYQRAGYQRQADTHPDATYEQVQECVRRELVKVRAALGADKPLVVIAHSLGAYIATSYIYDRQHWDNEAEGVDHDPRGATAFERAETLAGVITFGANLPLFAFATPRPTTINFPGKSLPAAIAAKAKWLNFYDKDDVLGWPLRHVYDAPEATIDRIEDRAINVGSILTNWNPASHAEYWTDREFVGPVADYLKGLLSSL